MAGGAPELVIAVWSPASGTDTDIDCSASLEDAQNGELYRRPGISGNPAAGLTGGACGPGCHGSVTPTPGQEALDHGDWQVINRMVHEKLP